MNYKHVLMLCGVTHYDGNILANVVSIRTVYDKPGFMLVDSQLAHGRINDNMCGPMETVLPTTQCTSCDVST